MQVGLYEERNGSKQKISVVIICYPSFKGMTLSSVWDKANLWSFSVLQEVYLPRKLYRIPVGA
jgi:hypothetical protein